MGSIDASPIRNACMSSDDWASGAAIWSPNDPEVKKDFSAAFREDLNGAERMAVRSWALHEHVEPDRLAVVSRRLAECCICRAERRRGNITGRIRGKPNRTKLLKQLEDNEISALSADIVDRALDMMTPEEIGLLADVRIKDLETKHWRVAEAMYDPARDVILVGGATGTESLGHEAIHRAAEKIREQLLSEALAIGEQVDRTLPQVRPALEAAERLAPSDRAITHRRYADIHVDVISPIPHAQRPEVLCALASWANRHPGSEAATWRLATEYWAHRAVRETAVKLDILRRAMESKVHLPRGGAWELPQFSCRARPFDIPARATYSTLRGSIVAIPKQ